MKDFGVYEDDMLTRFSDHDIERFFSGKMPEDEDLARLAPILKVLHGEHRISPTEEGVARFAAEASEVATSARPDGRTPEGTSARHRKSVLALRAKLATGLATVLLLAGTTGVAAASNGAAPGDILYGLDRALEAVGIGNGEAAERIAEAQALFNSGLVSEAVAHAALATDANDVTLGDDAEATIEAITSQEASEALLMAAEKLRTNTQGGDHAVEVRTNVASLLDYMATTEDSGSDFGLGVASHAREISNEPDEATDNADNTENAADAADNEGKAEESDDAGPPESVPPKDGPGHP